jgi:uncharacterized membrane protein
MPDRRRLTLLLLVLSLLVASALCVATVELRIRHSHDPSYRFLDWNLFLAWIPLVFALAAHAASGRRRGYVTVPFGLLWLLFFPNAPYMLTDFIHLQESSTTPLWYDGLMISSFAWTALVLGFVSLYLMQTIWRRAVGSLMGWIGVIGALALGSLGVYIGRFVGYNSWDALLHPVQVARVINAHLENPFHQPRLEESVIVLTGFLTIAYTAFYSLTSLRLDTSRRRQLTGRDHA